MLVVLISGRGSNLQALIDAIADGRLDATIAIVISNREDAAGLERARRAGRYVANAVVGLLLAGMLSGTLLWLLRDRVADALGNPLLLDTLPLLAAALTLLAHGRVRLQRLLSIAAVSAATVASGALLVRVEGGGTAVVQVGGWPAPFGITLVADLFSSLLLAVSMATVVGVLVYAIGQLAPPVEARFFHPLYLTLSAGVAASFLTGDLFNLFVAFEVMLIASYVLITISGNPESVRPAMTYVVVSLLTSTLFITAVGMLYAATGTVNMARLSVRIAGLPGIGLLGVTFGYLVAMDSPTGRADDDWA